MTRLLAILALAAMPVFAQTTTETVAQGKRGATESNINETRGQIEALQAALAQSQQQTAQANQIQLQMAVEIAALRKEIEALKKKDTPK